VNEGRIGHPPVWDERIQAQIRIVQWGKAPIVCLEVFRLVLWRPEYFPDGGCRRLR
jgi:hypothetical protein